MKETITEMGEVRKWQILIVLQNPEHWKLGTELPSQRNVKLQVK